MPAPVALTWRQVRRPYFFALFAVHSFFVAYSMSLVEVPRALEGEPEWVVGFVVGVFGMVPTAMFAVFGLLTPVIARRAGLEATALVAMLAAGFGMAARALTHETFGAASASWRWIAL